MSVELISKIWPEWKIEEQIGRGSFGVVYRAVRQSGNLTSYAAIKVISVPQDPAEIESLRAEGLDQEASRTYLYGIVEDFVNEIQMMESFKGIQNIVSVEDYQVVEKTDSVGWDILIRMELLTPFQTWLGGRRMSEGETIRLGSDICTALEICSARNIIHRDIKPENMFLNDFGFYKLGDFGIARKLENMTGGLSQKGTQNYMAPEVFHGQTYDARADVYSLGIVLYKLMNGNRPPFLQTEAQMLNPNERKLALERRLQGEALPKPCDASAALADVILKACAYDPAQRYASAAELKQALLAVNAGAAPAEKSGSQAAEAVSRETTGRKAKKPAKKRKSSAPLVIALILVLLLVGVGGYFAYSYMMDARAEEERIAAEAEEAEKTAKREAERIGEILDEAEQLAEEDQLEDAVKELEKGVSRYPDSQELQDQLEEYRTLLEAQHQQPLDEADKLVQAGDYAGAFAVLQTALTEHPDDADYEEAYANQVSDYKAVVTEKSNTFAEAEDYENAVEVVEVALEILPEDDDLKALRTDMKGRLEAQQEQEAADEVLDDADQLAQDGDYLGALRLVQEALKTMKDNDALQEAAKTYEDIYVLSVISQVDQLEGEETLAEAVKLLNDARRELPENEELRKRLEELSGSEEDLELNNPNQAAIPPRTGTDVNVAGGRSAEAAAAVELEDINHASFSEADVVDWYQITTTQNLSSYRFEVLNNSVNTTVYVAVLDAYQNELGEGYANKGETGYVDLHLESNTTYWLRVSRYNDSKTGNYQVTVLEKICDAGVSKSTPFAVALNQTYSKSLDVSKINDWFTFTASVNYAAYRFELMNNNVNTSVYLAVYDEYDTELGETYADKGNSAYLDLALEAGKQYRICISRYNEARLGNYQFTIRELICDAGLTQENAFELKLGEQKIGTLDTEFDDWYVCSFEKAGDYTFSLTNNNINTSLYLKIYDELGTELQDPYADKGKSLTCQLSVKAGAKLYVRLDRYNNARLGNYTLTVSR